MHVVLDKCYVFSFGNTTKVYSLSWQEAHEIEPNSVEQIKELLMLVTGGVTGRKKTCKWQYYLQWKCINKLKYGAGFKHRPPGGSNWQEAVFGKLCLWRAINLTATWWVTNTTRICGDISIQIITMQSGLIKGCPEIACLKITATTKDQ